MVNFTVVALAATAVFLVPGPSVAQVKHYALESAAGLGLHNVTAEPATLHGKRGVRLTLSEETRRALEHLTPEERNQRQVHQLARIADLEFSNGVIDQPPTLIVNDVKTGADGKGAIARWLRELLPTSDI